MPPSLHEFPHKLHSAVNLQSCRLLITGFRYRSAPLWRPFDSFYKVLAHIFLRQLDILKVLNIQITHIQRWNGGCQTNVSVNYRKRSYKIIMSSLLIKLGCQSNGWWQVLERWEIGRWSSVCVFLCLSRTQVWQYSGSQRHTLIIKTS